MDALATTGIVVRVQIWKENERAEVAQAAITI
jgi:hypothetical protein